MAGQDQQYKIVEAFITADRFLEKEIEVSGNIFEIIIYEDLESAWLTGSVIITDDTGIFSKISFKGTEYLTLRISGAEENSESIIDKTFLLYALTKTVKVNDTSSTYNFEMIEPHAYVSALKPFSRAYTGSLERTITQILNSELNKTVDLSYLTNSISAQGERKYIVPYLTPLEACEVLVDRTTTQFGSPFFLYSSTLEAISSDVLFKLNKIGHKTEANKTMGSTQSIHIVDEIRYGFADLRRPNSGVVKQLNN